MTNGVGISTYVVDKTKPGLLSALNNTTKITSDIAKKLALEVNVKFPSIADQTKDLKKQLSAASRSMGSINFVGERLGKRGNGLGLLGFDGKALRSDMSLDAVKRHLARLKEIQAKLDDNTLVSASVGEAFKKEQKDIIRAVRALEQYKTTLELVIRTNKKFQTKLTSEASYEQVNSKRRYNSQRHWIDEKVVNQEMDAEKKRREAERKAAIKSNEEIVKENERQFKRRVKAKRNAANIEIAIDNERVARERANSASAQTNAKRTERTLRDEIKALRELKSAEDALDRAQGKRARNARKNSQTNQRIRSLEQEANAIRRVAQEQAKANRTNAQLEKQYKSQGQLLGRLSSLASRYFSIYTIARFANNVAKTTGFFQQQQVALEGIIGSASKATTIFNDIQSFALQSPFQTKELVDFTKKLSAFGIEPDKLFPTVKELADISTGLGVDMGRIILAYGQVKSASVLRGQELRQFTEAGIPMVQALADKFTKMNGELVTTADIFEMISKRQVSFEVVADVLSDMTAEGGRFYKMQENVTNTLYGQIQKLKDLWTLALKDIGNSAGGFLNGVVSLLQKVVSNTKMVGAALAAAFVGNWIGKNIYGIVRIMTHLKSYIRLLRIAATLNKSAFIGFGLGAALAVGVGAFVKIKDELTKVKRKMQEISDSFTKETNKMIDGVNALIKRMRSATAGSKEWNDALETLKNNYGEYLDVNDAVLQKVIQGIDLNKEEKKSFDDLSESIAAAIKLKKEYEELTAKKNEAENLMSAEFAGMFKRNSKMLVSQIGEKGNLNEFFGTNYDKAINPQISGRVEAIFKSALDAFTSYGKTSFEDFKTIFKTMLNNEFIGSDLKGNSAETIIDSYLKTTFSSISGSSVFAEYLNIVGKLSGEGSSLFDSMVRINRLFEDNKFSPMENTPLGIHKEREEFYRDIFGKGLSKELEAIVNQEGTKESKNALIELMAVVADTEKGTYDVYAAFDNLLNAVGDLERRRVIADAANLYKKHTDALTDDEMAIAKNLESVTEFSNSVVQLDRKNKFKTQEYFEEWNPSVVGDQTIEQTREKISTEYQSLKKELDTYLSKDAKIFANEIKVIQEKMKVLEKIAGSSFYNVDLTDDKKGGAQQLPPELADFLSSLKNAYQRYNESVDKGGIGIGLNYVRTNEMFQEMFGEFFGGAEGEKFKALSGMKVGSHTVGELLSGKFLEGLEEGVIDFKAAALALAEDLESTNIKSYKQAGKQLRQWVDSTISKDSLNATMNELEKTIKDLTNSFEKVNKEVDLYRKLQENGTVNALGRQVGFNASMAATPDSVRMQGQIKTLLASLNEQLAAQSIAPISLGSLSRIDEVYKAIENLGKITMMNNKAFDGTALGKIGDNVNNLLKQLLETLIKEAASISGEVYSGSAMNDLIANATKRLQSGQFSLTSKENIARNLGTYDMAAIKTLVNATQEDAKKIFDQFMSDNRLDVIARKGNGKISDKTLDDLEKKLKDISKNFPDALRDELLFRLKDLRNKVGEYNASIGAWGAFGGAIRGYRNADGNAKREYNLEVENNDQIKARIELSKLLGVSSDKLNAELALSNERLKAMGENGEKLAEDLRKLSLANMQKSIQQCQEQFSSMVNSVNAVVDAAKAFANTINKVYDVMNDGENPAWMQDMESFLGDFGDAFGAMIAPMMSVISLVSTLTVAFVACEAAMTPLLIVMGVLIAVAAIVAGIVAAVQQHDRSLQRTIEDIEKQIEDTQTAMGNLDAAAERMVGIDKFKKQLESLSLNMKMYHDALEQAEAEEAKKNTDQDKVDEYKQNAQEYLDAFKNGLKGMFEEITGSVDELADAISSAMRSAFQSGENAARNMAAVVKENIGNIVEEIMKMNYLKPAIETAMNTLRGGSEDWFKEQFTDKEGNFDYESALDYFLGRLQNDENVENFEDMMNSISTGYIDLYDSLSDTMKEYFSFSSDNSALSGGISGITEDTARTLEGLANSMLMQMILTNRELSTISQSGFAQVQVSWFNDMLQQARATRIATENLNNAIAEMRNGVRPMSVTIS